MSAHTPGPWSAERVYVCIDDPTMRVTANAGNLYVAEASFSKVKSRNPIHVTDASEMAANACLIAAAPDLLDALRELMYARTDKAEHMARNAIFKATGAES